MELLLLTDIPGIGKKDDLVVVGDGYALNHLLPMRRALVATPNVRRRYAEQIKRRAEERQKEVEMRKSMVTAIAGKKVTIKRKATKTGKLYAAITSDMVAQAFADQHGTHVAAESIDVPDHMKTVGSFQATVRAGDAAAQIAVDVVAE